MYVYACECVYLQKTHWSAGYLGAGGTGICETPEMDAGT